MSRVESMQADVVVVGGGGSGLAAAAAAAESRVILLEKNPYLGGTTGLSVGSISAPCTPQQRKIGIVDSVDAFLEDLDKFAGEKTKRNNTILCRLLAEEATNTVTWLMKIGIEFFGPSPEPPHRYPRMLNAVPGCAAYIYCLSREAKKRGVRTLLSTSANDLIMKDGRVIGVKAKTQDGRVLDILAHRGVILATGDYSGSRDMKMKYISKQAANTDAVNPQSTGDGHLMALKVGAQLVNADLDLGQVRLVAPQRTWIESIPPTKFVTRAMRITLTHLPQFVARLIFSTVLTQHLAPSHRLYEEGAIIINQEGDRFVNELNIPPYAISSQPDHVAYIIFDNLLAKKFSTWPYYISTGQGIAYAYFGDYRRNRKDVYYEARTVPELAHKLKIDEKRVEDTVSKYNHYARQGFDADFGREQLGIGLCEAPFYALGPIKSFVTLTDGGLAVTTRMEVLNKEGKIISGLYAAGSTGQGGVILDGHGCHLLWVFTSGRLAGQSAVSTDDLTH